MQTSKIVFSNGTVFDTADYPVETEPPIFSRRFHVGGEQRDTVRVTVTAAYSDVLESFLSGATWAIRQFEINPDTGAPTEEYTDYDKSEYCVAGDIVNHRDGRITVYMGKKTEAEQLRDALDALIIDALEGSDE